MRHCLFLRGGITTVTFIFQPSFSRVSYHSRAPPGNCGELTCPQSLSKYTIYNSRSPLSGFMFYDRRGFAAQLSDFLFKLNFHSAKAITSDVVDCLITFTHQNPISFVLELKVCLDISLKFGHWRIVPLWKKLRILSTDLDESFCYYL